MPDRAEVVDEDWVPFGVGEDEGFIRRLERLRVPQGRDHLVDQLNRPLARRRLGGVVLVERPAPVNHKPARAQVDVAPQ